MRKIYGKFHYPKKMDEIMLGNREQYVTTKQLIDEFKKFIINTWDELAKYSKEELASVGITTPENYSSQDRKGTFELNISGSKLHINLWDYESDNDLYVSACQWGELDNSVRRLTGGAITASRRILDFDNRDFSVGRETSESHFSFGFEDTDFKGIPSGAYIEGFLPHPTGKVDFDEKKGYYVIINKSASEKPKRCPSDGTYYEEYCNIDNAPYVSEPFICTTYSSFEAANEDIINKTIAFQTAWRKALDELRANYKKPSGHKIKTRTQHGLSTALGMAIFQK